MSLVSGILARAWCALPMVLLCWAGGAISEELYLGMRDTEAIPGERTWIPVYLANYEEADIYGCRFTFRAGDADALAQPEYQPAQRLAGSWNGERKTASDGGYTYTFMADETGDGPLGYGGGRLAVISVDVPAGRAGQTGTTLNLSNIIFYTDDKAITGSPVQAQLRFVSDLNESKVEDVDGDGDFDESDAGVVLRCGLNRRLAQPPLCDEYSTAELDFSGDGVIDSRDASLLLRYLVGLIPRLPDGSWQVDAQPVTYRGDVFLDAPRRLAKDVYRYTVKGRNVSGLLAAEMVLKWDPGKVAGIRNIESMRGSIVAGVYDADGSIYSISLAGNDAAETGEVDLAAVDVEYGAGASKIGMTIGGALLYHAEGVMLAAGTWETGEKIRAPTNQSPAGVITGGPSATQGGSFFDGRVLHIRNSGRQEPKVRIVDMSGRVVPRRICFRDRSFLRLDLSAIPPGRYLAVVETRGTSEVTGFVSRR